MSLKVNVTTSLELKLTYFETTVNYFIDYTAGTARVLYYNLPEVSEVYGKCKVSVRHLLIQRDYCI